MNWRNWPWDRIWTAIFGYGSSLLMLFLLLRFMYIQEEREAFDKRLREREVERQEYWNKRHKEELERMRKEDLERNERRK